MSELKNKTNGTILIESAFIIPLLFLAIFFIIELWNIISYQTRLDAIVAEATKVFSSTKSADEFDAIMRKHINVNKINIRYYFERYKNSNPSTGLNGIKDIGKSGKICGSELFFPNETGNAYTSASPYIDLQKSGNPSFDSDSGDLIQNPLSNDFLKHDFFILTFVMEYKFFTSITKKVFNNGSNSIIKSDSSSGYKQSDKYLIWSRGIGIIE